MTTHKGRHIPHPVIRVAAGDYQPEYAYTAQERTARLDQDRIINALQHQLRCPELQARIDQGQAQYTIIVNCPAARRRETRNSADPNQSLTLPLDRFYGHISINALITTADFLTRWQSQDWSPDIQEALERIFRRIWPLYIFLSGTPQELMHSVHIPRSRMAKQCPMTPHASPPRHQTLLGGVDKPVFPD